VAAPAPRHWHVWGRHLVLFLLTAVSVYLTGATVGWLDAAGELHIWDVRAGLTMMAALMSILLCHEMGHYVACRIYRIDATLPFFIPAPFLFISGTLGAVIRIKEPFPNRRALFDVGVAGPLAGFAVCIPVLIGAVFEARIIPMPVNAPLGSLWGDPLFFTWAFELLRGPVPAGHILAIDVLGRAAWFGLLVTGLNLLPVGQLDGGHALYALFRRRAHVIARGVWWTCVGLIVLGGPSWILWSILVRIIGIRHPPTLHDDAPLGRARVAVAILCALIFAGSFIYAPISFTWAQLWREIRG
jgi:membrane-associated protease RseP (regulator of RpoE activity)